MSVQKQGPNSELNNESEEKVIPVCDIRNCTLVDWDNGVGRR